MKCFQKGGPHWHARAKLSEDDELYCLSDGQFVNLSQTVASTVSQKPTILNQAVDKRAHLNHTLTLNRLSCFARAEMMASR